MLGTIEEGTRAYAIEIMVADGGCVVHQSFGPGDFFEFDAHQQIFVDAEGSDVTADLFQFEILLSGWHEWNNEDKERENKHLEKLEAERAEEEAEKQRRIDANVDGYTMKDFAARVFQDGSHIYFKKAKSGSAGRAKIEGFRLTVVGKAPSVEYLVRYDTTGCSEWLPGVEVFASKLDLAASVMASV